MSNRKIIIFNENIIFNIIFNKDKRTYPDYSRHGMLGFQELFSKVEKLIELLLLLANTLDQ